MEERHGTDRCTRVSGINSADNRGVSVFDEQFGLSLLLDNRGVASSTRVLEVWLVLGRADFELNVSIWRDLWRDL